MASIHGIEKHLEEHMQVALFNKNDCFLNGLQVQGTKEIKKIATAVTATTVAIKKAIDLDADALFVHHGLFFKDRGEPLCGSLYEKIQLLIDSGMSLFVYHLPLDAHQTVGTTWPLAHRLGWSDLEPLAGGFGVIGNCSYENPQMLYDVLSPIFQKQGSWVGPQKPLTRCAFVAGKGNSFFGEALRLGADCFITGTQDAKEWDMAHEENAVFMTFGHHATERLGVQLLGEYVAKTFSIESCLIDENNPF